MLQLPVAFDAVMSDPVLKDTAMNKSFLTAVKQLTTSTDLDKNKVLSSIQELKALIEKGGDEAAFAEEFWRSNIGSFVKAIWSITHLGPILKRIPQVTVVNAWKTLKAFWDNREKRITVKGGTYAATLAALELLQFLASGSIMTGLLGKVLIALHMTTLGIAFAGGAWIAWGLVSLLHKDDHSSEEQKGAKLIAGVIKAIDPGANLNLVDKWANKNNPPTQTP